jgi:hypothetical protein
MFRFSLSSTILNSLYHYMSQLIISRLYFQGTQPGIQVFACLLTISVFVTLRKVTAM